MRKSSWAIALTLFYFISSPIVRAEPGWNATGFPLAYYTPETGLGAVAVLLLTHRYEDFKKEDRPNSMPVTTFITTRGQYGFTLGPDFYFQENRWEARGFFSYTYFPNNFYGLGNNSPEENLETFVGRSLVIQPTVLRRLNRFLQTGINLSYRRMTLDNLKEGGLLARSTIPGSQGGSWTGAGPLIEWDNRNHSFFPTHGGWYKLQATYFGGSSQSLLSQYLLDLRQFIPLTNAENTETVLSFQIVTATSSSEIPFDAYTPLQLRGLVEERFRDRSVLFGQSELRFPIAGNFNGAAFMGTGRVADGLDQLSLAHQGGLKWSAGLGIRYRVEPKEKINIRFDFGFGPWGMAPYILLQESF